jgi:hypothetical protein
MSDETSPPNDESPETDEPQPEAAETAPAAPVEEVFSDNWEGKMKQIVAGKIESDEYESTAMACAKIADAQVIRNRNQSGSEISRPLWSQVMPRLVARMIHIQSATNRGGDKTIENSLIACGHAADEMEAAEADVA